MMQGSNIRAVTNLQDATGSYVNPNDARVMFSDAAVQARNLENEYLQKIYDHVLQNNHGQALTEAQVKAYVEQLRVLCDNWLSVNQSKQQFIANSQ